VGAEAVVKRVGVIYVVNGSVQFDEFTCSRASRQMKIGGSRIVFTNGICASGRYKGKKVTEVLYADSAHIIEVEEE
jgi:hypothetical protein